MREISLEYGHGRRIDCRLAADRVLAVHRPPAAESGPGEATRAAIERPLDFPPLAQAVISDDRVTLAVEPDTPHVAKIVAEVWRILHSRGVDARRVTIIEPDRGHNGATCDPRTALPESVRSRVVWKIHDPAAEGNCCYLASSGAGERIYLAREVTEADLVVSIGPICFDPLLGYRGTGSVFYPWLSNHEAILRARGQGHRELTPENSRPLRQLIDEIAWLLGTQFTIQTVSAGGGKFARVLAGGTDSVFRSGRELLCEHWNIKVDVRPDIVVAAVENDAGGHGWEQIGAAVAAARSLVAHGGRIVVLSDVNAETGPGMDMLRAADESGDARQPLRLELHADVIPATQLINGVEWARVYLLSRIRSDLAEELFLIPLEGADEVNRLLGGDESCVFLQSAQTVHAEIRGV